MDRKKTDIAAKAISSSKEVERPLDDPEREDYAEHLARVTPDADRNKALLQARYKALHDEDDPSDPH